MPVYSVNRRRAIILLILSSVLLLTLDIRGNAVVDRARNVFSSALSPFVTAGEVISTPIKNAWHGATDYQGLRRENEALRDQIAQQRGDQLTARAVVSDYQELVTLAGLQANYPRVTARVVGGRTSNFRQTVDIDRGADDHIMVGMTVINAAGLIGKITQVYDDRSVVLLVTDQDYAIDCKVSGAPLPTTSTTLDPTVETTPSGENRDDLGSTTSAATTTTIAEATAAGSSTTISGSFGAAPGTPDPATTTTTPATTTTSTTAPALVERETGGCEGRGSESLPVMKFVTESPQFGPIGVGDVVATAGGESLAPPDIIIGEVVNKIERASSAGPLLEIELAADLDHLSLVQIVLTRPTSELPG